MPRELRASLLEPGAAPRVARRYKIAPGDERTVAVNAVVTERRYRGGDWHGPTTRAPIVDGFAVAGDGTGALAVRGLVGAVVTDASTVAPADAALLDRWRALLERRRLRVAIDERGRLGAVSFADDPDRRRADAVLAEDEFAQRWLTLAVPWPEEPIGVGARWKVVSVLRLGGVYLKQTATYALTAVAGDRATVAIDIERLGEPQALAVPGVLAELIALRRHTAGTVVVGGADPLPLSGELTSEQSSHVRVSDGGPVPADEITDDRATLRIGPS